MSRPAHKNINAKGRRVAKRLLALQCLTAFILVGFFWVVLGTQGAVSALAGVVVGLIPNSIFAAFAFRHSGAHSAHSVVNNFIAGEALKIMLSMILLVVALLVLDGPLLPLFAIFALLHLMHLLAPVLLLKTN